MKSESIKELAVALAKAQQEIKSAHKDADNPFFKSKYADLTSVWNACRDALNKNGLSIVQGPQWGSGECLETTLIHSSGEWISTLCPLINKKEDMQGLGSAISYARRYSIAAICGVVTEDDDANTADNKTSESKPIQKNVDIQDSKEKCSPAQAKMIFAKLSAKGYIGHDVSKWLVENFKFVDTASVPFNRVNEVVAAINSSPPKKGVGHKDYSEPPEEPSHASAFNPDIPWIRK